MDSEYLERLANCLDNAERTGSNEDNPEGNRLVQISDTLARQISGNVRAIAKRMVQNETT